MIMSLTILQVHKYSHTILPLNTYYLIVTAFYLPHLIYTVHHVRACVRACVRVCVFVCVFTCARYAWLKYIKYVGICVLKTKLSTTIGDIR